MSGAKGLCACLRLLFADRGVPREMSSDPGSGFKSAKTTEFLEKWGVIHRLSSAYFPQSNGRAEVAVKTAKRLLMDNTLPNGSLDTDKFLKALLIYRNTPDPQTQISPAQLIYVQPLSNSFKFMASLDNYTDTRVGPQLRAPEWHKAWAEREAANRVRFYSDAEQTNEHTRDQRPLRAGERILVQNRHGNSPLKWGRSGTIVERGEHGSYTLKVDRSGRISQRTRQHLRPIRQLDDAAGRCQAPRAGGGGNTRPAAEDAMEEIGLRPREVAPDVSVVPLPRQRDKHVPEMVAADPPPANDEDVGQRTATPPQPAGPENRPAAPAEPQLPSTPQLRPRPQRHPNTSTTPLMAPRQLRPAPTPPSPPQDAREGFARHLEDTSRNLVKVLPSSLAAAPIPLKDNPLGGWRRPGPTSLLFQDKKDKLDNSNKRHSGDTYNASRKIYDALLRQHDASSCQRLLIGWRKRTLSLARSYWSTSRLFCIKQNRRKKNVLEFERTVSIRQDLHISLCF